MQLHVSTRYAAEGFNAIIDGQETTIANLSLAVIDGNAVTLEADDTPSDNLVNIQTSDEVGAVATLTGAATSEDGSRSFVMVPEPVELIAKDLPLGSFNLRFVELVG